MVNLQVSRCHLDTRGTVVVKQTSPGACGASDPPHAASHLRHRREAWYILQHYSVYTRCDMDETAVITHRVPADLKRAFEQACKANDQTASQVIRALMREYVRKNAQGSLLK